MNDLILYSEDKTSSNENRYNKKNRDRDIINDTFKFSDYINFNLKFFRLSMVPFCY